MSRSFGKKFVTLKVTTKMSKLIENVCLWRKKLNLFIYLFEFPIVEFLRAQVVSLVWVCGNILWEVSGSKAFYKAAEGTFTLVYLGLRTGVRYAVSVLVTICGFCPTHIAGVVFFCGRAATQPHADPKSHGFEGPGSQHDDLGGLAHNAEVHRCNWMVRFLWPFVQSKQALTV